MFDKIKSLFGEKPKAKTSTNSAPPTPRVKAKEPEKTAKEIANEKDEPYVSVLGLELDADNLHQGAFELDWNEKFVANLVRAGYMMKPTDTDAEIVDRWFQNVCRHVVMETWEQEQAMNPQRFTKSRDIGGGRREVS
jgi:hypothetical protein